MKVKTKIQIYEIDGTDTGINYPKLTIKRHWNRYRNLMVLKFGKKEITICVQDLERSIRAVTAD